jgi:hypothetical protein
MLITIRTLFYESMACFSHPNHQALTIGQFSLSIDIDCSEKVSNYICLKADFSMGYPPI